MKSRPFAKNPCAYGNSWGRIPHERPGARFSSHNQMRTDFWQTVYIISLGFRRSRRVFAPWVGVASPPPVGLIGDRRSPLRSESRLHFYEG